MTFRQKLMWGLLLTILGFIGIFFASSLGFTSLDRPWSFITGFITGIIITLGVGMLISGLVDQKGK
jgi:hypothetical protein